MEIQSAIQEIIKNLEKWCSENVLVVGLDGYSGIGKTTVSKGIMELASFVEVLHMDDYATTANTKERLLPQIEGNSPELILEWKPKDGIASLKEAIKSTAFWLP